MASNPKAKRCYAWFFEENGEKKLQTILHSPPEVDSPELAVKRYISSLLYPKT
jgi:hypothetical protein